MVTNILFFAFLDIAIVIVSILFIIHLKTIIIAL